MSEMLKVSDLHVYYGSIHAVKGVSFEVHEGEVVTLIGANGAGKSTILNTVSGLLHPRSGSILFHGKDLHGVPAHKLVGMGLAQVPEGRHVFLQMTVQENLEMGAFSQPSSGIEADLESVYQRFPRLLERRKQIAGTLSGGEQQMLAVARALMSRPKLMMMDEPSLGLAPWWNKSSESSGSCTLPAPPSSWSNRTLRPPWRSPTGPMSWKPAASFFPVPAPS